MITLYGTFGFQQDICVGHFPDGTQHLNFPDNDIHAIEWRYESDEEIFTLYCAKRHYNERNASLDINLLLPYIPNARMDRVKNVDDVFTLKYFCEIINSLNFKEVWVLDAHSNVSLALLDRVFQMPVEEGISRAIDWLLGDKKIEKVEGNLVLFFPDEGSMKRYSDMFDLPYAFGIKKRNWKTGKIEGLEIMHRDVLEGKHVLIVDDICSKGGTFFHAANAIVPCGVKSISLYVTHAENTMIEGEMYNTPGLIEHIFTTKTIFDETKDVRHKVHVVQNY